jgi:hypothetical protein
MEKLNCCVCQKPKATLVCGICESPVCKYCAQFTDDSTFAFLPALSPDLQHDTFCGPCFDAKVAPVQAEYARTLGAAKSVLVFAKNQGKETRLMKRLADPVQVVNCPDEKEAILRLAFLAALGGYNAIVDMDLQSERQKNGSYRTTIWRGTAIPVNIDPAKLLKDRALWSNPN